MTDEEIRALSSAALAHMGDAVYELLVREMLCREGRLTAGSLHKDTVRYVAAPAQARFAALLQPLLTSEEESVYRRARNAHSHAAPKGATEGEYHAATALEALFGWLYLKGRKDRIRELFDALMEENGHGA